MAEEIAGKMKRGYVYAAAVSAITGGEGDRNNLGMNILAVVAPIKGQTGAIEILASTAAGIGMGEAGNVASKR